MPPVDQDIGHSHSKFLGFTKQLFKLETKGYALQTCMQTN